MNDRTLLRLAGAAAVLAGAIRIAVSFMPWGHTVMDELVASTIDVLLLFGLMGIYLAQRAALGWFGLAAFALAETGIASIIGPDTVSFGIDTYQAGVAAISIGLAWLSVVMLLKRAGPAAAAVCWIASLIVLSIAQSNFQSLNPMTRLPDDPITRFTERC